MITRMDTVRILAPAGEAIPAKSLAEITGYSEANLYFTTQKPSADGLAAGKVVIVPEAIPAGEVGLAYYDGIHVVTVSGTVNAGDGLGSKASSWSAQTVASDPILYAMAMVNGDAIARTTGGGGGTGGGGVALEVLEISYVYTSGTGTDGGGRYKAKKLTYNASASGANHFSIAAATEYEVQLIDETVDGEDNELAVGDRVIGWLDSASGYYFAWTAAWAWVDNA